MRRLVIEREVAGVGARDIVWIGDVAKTSNAAPSRPRGKAPPKECPVAGDRTVRIHPGGGRPRLRGVPAGKVPELKRIIGAMTAAA